MPGSSTTRISSYDIFCAHTMVGSLDGTDNYFRTSASGTNSHFGVGGDGTIYQWVDTAYRSGANYNGNYHIVSVETADMGAPFGPWGGTDVPAWTAAQIDALGRIARWVHDTHGIPLTQIPDAKPGRRGVGYHRLGVPGYMVAGAEQWSTAQGKVCPGDRRISQVPQVIARAQGGQPAPTVSGESDMAVISSPGRGTAVVGPGYFRQLNAEEAGNTAPFGPVIQGNDRQFDLWRSMALGGVTAVWSTTVSRTDATTDGKTMAIPALQELADAKTQAAAVNAQMAGFQAALAAVDTGKGGVDVDAIRAAVDAAVRESIQSIDVTVNTKAAQ
jgi:hypothetical protein